jgi:hypothetical protein
MTRRRDGKKIIGMNCNRTSRSKFRIFCKEHAIPNELADAITENINSELPVMFCICRRRAKFEKIKASEGVSVAVVTAKNNEYSFYAIENKVVVYLPTRKKDVKWYNYIP